VSGLNKEALECLNPNRPGHIRSFPQRLRRDSPINEFDPHVEAVPSEMGADENP
jgi:hypothetical protein